MIERGLAHSRPRARGPFSLGRLAHPILCAFHPQKKLLCHRRSGNTHADSLATLATSSAGGLPRIILVEHLDRAGEVAKDTVRIHEIRVVPSWMDPIIKFLKDDTLPEEKSEAEKIRRNALQFWLSEDHKLYKRSYSGSYFLCIHLKASELLLAELLHEGICGSYTGGRSLSHRAIT